jgi:putative flippase GtrA
MDTPYKTMTPDEGANPPAAAPDSPEERALLRRAHSRGGRRSLRWPIEAARYWIHQIMRFGMVGSAATLTHAGVYYYLVAGKVLTPLLANFAAYVVAFSISFLGHRHWTFGDARKDRRNNYAIFRFLSVSLSGLAINSAAVLLLVNLLRLPDWTPLFVIVGMTPIFTFLLNRFWVFYTLRHP